MSLGFVLPALSIGLGSIRVKPTRGFYPSTAAGGASIQPHATLGEMHRDDLEITSHPVEVGAPVADHAFKRPAEVVIRCAWSDGPQNSPGIVGAALGTLANKSSLVRNVMGAAQTVSAIGSMLSGNGTTQGKAVYQQLRDLQASRIPFDVYTGKRVYRNMLFRSLAATTDAEHENCLLITATCCEVILVKTTTVKTAVNASAQGMPDKTSPIMKYGQKALKSLPSIPSGLPSLSLPSGLSSLKIPSL